MKQQRDTTEITNKAVESKQIYYENGTQTRIRQAKELEQGKRTERHQFTSGKTFNCKREVTWGLHFVE